MRPSFRPMSDAERNEGLDQLILFMDRLSVADLGKLWRIVYRKYIAEAYREMRGE